MIAGPGGVTSTLTAAVALPATFVAVTVCHEAGERRSGVPAICRSGVAPLHVSATVFGDAGSSVGMFSVPVFAPIVDGSHRSVIVVLPPAATDGSVPQLCPVVHDPNANE